MDVNDDLLIVVDGRDVDDVGDYVLNINECVEDCTNGVDDDNDGDIDCSDADCASATPCAVETCDNGIDDDGNGAVDCADADCRGAAVCRELCHDGIDNDFDGRVDCSDTDCGSDPACIACPMADADLGSITGDLIVTGSTEGLGDDASASCGTPVSGEDLLLSWVAPSTGCFLFDLAGSNYETVLHVHEECPSFVELGCNAVSGAANLRLSVVSGQPYLVAVDGQGTDSEGTYALGITPCVEDCSNQVDDDLDGIVDCADTDCASNSDCIAEICDNAVDDDGDGDTDCADDECAQLMACSCPVSDWNIGYSYGDGVVVGSTVGASANVTASCGGTASPDVVVEWLATSSGCYIVDTVGSTFNTVLHVYEACPSFQELACDDDGGTANTSAFEFVAFADEKYQFVISGYSDTDVGDYTLNINPCP